MNLLVICAIVIFKVENYCPIDYVKIKVSVNSLAQAQKNTPMCTIPNDPAYPQCMAKVNVS